MLSMVPNLIAHRPFHSFSLLFSSLFLHFKGRIHAPMLRMTSRRQIQLALLRFKACALSAAGSRKASAGKVLS